ncbi:hypothetical protein EUBDOL_01531 [Amedibacillus dolichus DSM 3991]|uniref:Ribbon-helix-helix protein CopG domain-containing protein n=2 Tax=Amedibacillus dolichus TaxID=31971 RepID=A8RCX7_9FIRM|nr:hypothetical protein EUBDOL_01531 [Amedibacillus dolichus DSM 3991]
MSNEKERRTMSDKKKVGRPPIDNARTERMAFRVTKEEKEELKTLAQKKGLTITELILQGIEKMK